MPAYAAAATIANDVETSSRKTRFIDASWSADGDARRAFATKRIPGAVFYDHDASCDLSSPLPQAFPSRATHAEYAGGALGTRASDDVVVYAQSGDS